MSSAHRERHTDSDALDSTLEEDLDSITRRRERERAAHAASAGPKVAEAPETGGAPTRKDLDAEARPRELEDGAMGFPRRRRPGPAP